MPSIPYPSVPSGQFGVPIVPVAPAGVSYPPNPTSSFNSQPLPASTGPKNNPKTPKWQLLDDKNRVVITPDSVVAFEYRNQQRVLNYPIEEGSFSSYNKVATPFDIRAVLSCGGNGKMTRQQFIKAIDEMTTSTNLYSFVTPDRVYKSVNLVQANYRRTSNHGATLIQAELLFQEIRETVESTVTTTEPDGSPSKSNGQVAPVPPTAKQVAAKGSIN